MPVDERTPKHEIAHARVLENMVAETASHDAKALKCCATPAGISVSRYALSPP
ncbi:hypothetical protein BN2476_210037 [Paraburkholderia piptadeniae]|uniref:Uncharacterized protein n=1 Tax=Paraburkholderia piptadeniae TaxID=1701573 RepID=A0A1N7RVG5_9BURK|nr:hypothetical protein [Paraburkholderia piptadeniae]SIT39090.1 hypothetical protein BN2476_210037 [Paraburkholderia piptadeniae]